MLFIHAKHSPTKLYQCTCTVLLSNHNQSIHINLSAGAQNITGVYICNNYAFCRHLLTTRLFGKAAV